MRTPSSGRARGRADDGSGARSDALPAVLRHRLDAHLRILGGGPDEAALRLHAARLGLRDRIEIRAERDREAMAATLARAKAVVSLSEYELARAGGPRGPVALAAGRW
jgi:glycosyltransferase involved in cell wall biosynthesis